MSLIQIGSEAMSQFDPQLVQVMRGALEEAMRRVPLEYSSSATKVYLAERILKAAAQGQTSYDELVAAAAWSNTGNPQFVVYLRDDCPHSFKPSASTAL
jgi:hypothetical protein